MNIAENTIVAIDYVLTNDAGEEIDSSFTSTGQGS